MKIEITGEAKEIAVFALELQRPQPFNVPNKEALSAEQMREFTHYLESHHPQNEEPHFA